MNETYFDVIIVNVGGKLSETQREQLAKSIAEAIATYSSQSTLIDGVEGIDVLVRTHDDYVAIRELSNL